MSTGAIQIRAHAKLNLDLRVLGVRADGYHEVRTLYQALDLHDTLTFVPRRGPFAIRCTTPGVPRDERNLVWRSASLLWSELGRPGAPRDVSVTIEKAIPMQGGLAGGSTDAAAALVALWLLWGDGSNLPLEPLAARVGADVAFFLSGGTALGLGAGEEIYPVLDLPRYWVAIACPPFGVSTVDAYRWCDADRAAGLDGGTAPQFLPGLPRGRRAEMLNDLEPPVVRRHAEIATWRARLEDAGAEAAAMSGSGSAVFGLFPTRTRAARAASAISNQHARVLLTRTISRDEYALRARPVAKRR